MKVLFFNPIQICRRWPIPSDYTRFIADVPAVTYPQLAACIPEHKCEIFDGLVDSDIKKGLQKIKGADIVAITVPTEISALNTEININLIKKINPSAKVIVGGYPTKEYDREWIEKGVDFVVRGEGEITFSELIGSLEKNKRAKEFSKIKGLTFKNKEKIIRNSDRPLIKNLDSLPIPRWDLLDLRKYHFPLGNERKYTSCVETSRGCVKECSFCAIAPFWGFKQRFKSADRVIEELSVINELGIGNFFIADNNCWQNHKRDKEIVSRIISNRMDFRFGSFARAESIVSNPGLFRLSSKAGLVYLLVGYESLKSRVLSLFKKSEMTSSYSLYKKAYNITNKNNILNLGLFVIGYPGETIEEAEFTLKNCYDVCDFPLFNVFIPSKGTYAASHLPISSLKKDMFYHDTQSCGIRGQEAFFKKSREFFFGNILGICHIMKMFHSNRMKRIFFRRMYRSLAMLLIQNFNYNSIEDFRNMMRYSIEKGDLYQKNLNKKYLDEKFLDRIIANNS